MAAIREVTGEGEVVRSGTMKKNIVSAIFRSPATDRKIRVRGTTEWRRQRKRRSNLLAVRRESPRSPKSDEYSSITGEHY